MDREEFIDISFYSATMSVRALKLKRAQEQLTSKCEDGHAESFQNSGLFPLGGRIERFWAPIVLDL